MAFENRKTIEKVKYPMSNFQCKMKNEEQCLMNNGHLVRTFDILNFKTPIQDHPPTYPTFLIVFS
jgi:hypothetical protein